MAGSSDLENTSGTVGSPSQDPSIDAGSVLVVDDNPLIVNVLKAILASEGYKIFIARNGAEAVELLSNKQVDLIICDVMMPKMDGYEFHSHLRKVPEHCHVPFIFLTALSDQPTVNKGKELGADDYVVKPFDPVSLLSIVKGKVQRSHALKSMSEEKYDSYRKKVIHTLSHEFRTPLVAINTGTELLLDQQSALDTQKAKHLLEAIKRGGERLERLVSDFMILQQIEAGISKRLFESRKKISVLSELIVNFLDARAERLKRDGATYVLEDKSGGGKVLIYEPQIIDLFDRLLDNSVKFSPTRKQVEFHLFRIEDDLVAEVRDRGLGLDPQRAKEAIDVFGQLDRDKLEQQGGGMGLAIASRYAHINNGRLDFEKRAGGGSVVSLILPIHKEDKK